MLLLMEQSKKTQQKKQKEQNEAHGWQSRRSVLGTSLTVGSLAVAGCSDLLGGSTEDFELDPEDPPEKPDSITVRAWGGVWEDSIDEAIAEPFTEDTGIDVEYDNTERTVMQGDIQTAIQQDREPPVNVMWTVEPAAYEEHLMELPYPIEDGIVTNQQDLLDDAIPDVDGDLPYISLYSYTYAMSYNEEALEDVHGSPDPPCCWSSLQDEQWEGELAIDNNGHGVWAPLAEMADTPLDSDDLDPVYDELEDLEPAFGVIGNEPTMVEALRQGEVSVALMLMNNIFEYAEDGEPLGWTVPEEGATVRMDSMYTPRNQTESETYWSQEFINYAADEDVQETWTDLLGLPMANENAEPLDYMQDDPAYPTAEEDFEQLVAPDYEVYAENSSDWFEQFDIIVGS